MAKNIVLYGVFLGFVVCVCACFSGVDLETRDLELGTRDLELGTRGLVEGDTVHPVNLSDNPSFGVFNVKPGIICRIEGIICNNSEMNEFKHDAQSTSLTTRDLKSTTRGKKMTTRSVLQEIYTAEIGVREKTGKNDGPRVEEYLAVTNLGKGYAWCTSFVSWVFAEAGFEEPRTAWSPALFPKGRVIWERGKSTSSTSNLAPKKGLVPSSQFRVPNTGDIFGIYFSNLKRIAHAGFIDEWGDKYLLTVEGNTNEAGSNEGDGVYRKRRPISSIYQVANWIGKGGVK